jgi:hypothetical protein
MELATDSSADQAASTWSLDDKPCISPETIREEINGKDFEEIIAESFCLRTFNKWGLGRKGIDDGILICMAMKERRVRIELGFGMERYISNADAKAIIDKDMTPSFAKGDFAGGLELGLKRLMVGRGRRFTARNAETSDYDLDSRTSASRRGHCAAAGREFRQATSSARFVKDLHAA